MAMARVIRDVVVLLNRLIQLHYDAIDACKAAVAHVEDPRARQQLCATLEDHRGHVDELAVVVRNLGGEPASPSDLRPLRANRRRPTSLEGEHALLEALGRNEEGARVAYEDAASLPGVPLDVLAALERNLADQRKHLAWLAGRLETILASAEAPRSEPCSTTLK
jgi:uncharacterized protein (TIGR02284 family)